MFRHDLGAETSEGQKIEENVQFGPTGPPLAVALPSWIGTQSNVMYIAVGLVAAYLVYKYVYDVREA
jgi:hypothetical protein